MTQTIDLTATDRASAQADISEARRLTRRAGKGLDGLTATERHNCTTALVALTDALDAIVHAEATDRELEGIERASREESEGERGLRAFCEERGIGAPNF